MPLTLVPHRFIDIAFNTMRSALFHSALVVPGLIAPACPTAGTHTSLFQGKTGRTVAEGHLLEARKNSTNMAINRNQTVLPTAPRPIMLVDSIRFELTTSSMPLRRSSN